jgi:acyl-coenzyme A thioesterase PaaI-like protein
MVKMPASRNCFVCGRENPLGLKMTFYTTKPGTVEAQINLPKDYEGFPNIVHGGILSAILDEVTGRAQMSFKDRFMVTAQLTMRFRMPVLVDQNYTVLGVAGEIKGRVSKSTGQILDMDGRIMAEADAVFVDLTQEQIDSMADASDYWKIYPDVEEA